jgi:hypothetical protein
MPSNYRKVLVAKGEAQEQGLDEDATVKAMMEAASNG